LPRLRMMPWSKSHTHAARVPPGPTTRSSRAVAVGVGDEVHTSWVAATSKEGRAGVARCDGAGAESTDESGGQGAGAAARVQGALPCGDAEMVECCGVGRPPRVAQLAELAVTAEVETTDGDVEELKTRRRGRPAMGSGTADVVPVRIDP